MASEVSLQGSPRSVIGPVLWGVATALAAVAAVTLIAAGWITLRGYPDHAQSLSVPLADINPIAGEVEETETGVRLVPDDRGVAIVLFDGAPQFPAFQFSELTLDLADAAFLRGGQALWASRKAPNKTPRVPLNRDGTKLSADLAESSAWTDRINGIGVALMTQGPVELRSATLRPHGPTFIYVLTRMWQEWSYREGYHGHTINHLKGAGQATLVPTGLAGGLVLFLSGGGWLFVNRKSDRANVGQSGLLAVTITLWLLLSPSWIREVWVEAIWSVRTYAGNTEVERRLSEPDAHLYKVAQQVKSLLPTDASRIWLLSGNRKFTEFSRWKLKYYLAPLNATLAVHGLPRPNNGSVKAGDYLLIAKPDLHSKVDGDYSIEPGYTAELLGTFQKFGLLRITSE